MDSLPCLTCGGFGFDAACVDCGVERSSLFHENPVDRKPDCKECYNYGRFEPCPACGRQTCEGDVNGFSCGGFGTPDGCPDCGRMYPLYRPVCPDSKNKELQERIAVMKDRELAALAKKGLASGTGWSSMPKDDTRVTGFEKSSSMWGGDEEVSDLMVERLREILEREGLSEEFENTEHVGNWMLEDGNVVSLFSDGGDAYKPGCLFVRGDYVHVPLRPWQDELCAAVYDINYFETRYDQGDRGQKSVDLVTEYLSHVLNGSFTWRESGQ